MARGILSTTAIQNTVQKPPIAQSVPGTTSGRVPNAPVATLLA